MTDIERIDPNFRVEPAFSRDGLVFYDVTKPPFSLHGLLYEGDCFRRLPQAVAEAVSEEVALLSLHTAGGRVRFVTDSKRVAIHAVMHAIEKMSHFALTGSGGFDLFEDERYLTTFIPPFGFTNGFSSQKVLESREERLLTMHFPLYSGVKELYIGVEEDTVVRPAPAFAAPPVVFYGSSITQGGCASKPGSAFPAMVGQMLNADHWNLGFSGSCKGEQAMADYLAAIPMSAFVCGYDHNAPTLGHLQKTHLSLVRAVREAHPDIPILLFGRPKAALNDEEQARRAVVAATCAAVNGIFIPNEALIPAEIASWATVDGVHPNDLGFYHMAKAVTGALRSSIFPPSVVY